MVTFSTRDSTSTSMPLLSTLALFGLLKLPMAQAAASWNLSETYSPQDFLDTSKFTYFTTSATLHDPTHGLVNYLSASAAKAANLSSVQDDVYIMKVDDVQSAPSGRNSVRITSTGTYSDGIYVVNITHAPVGCGTWPAIWTVTSDLDTYPTGGEIDILEGANDQHQYNTATLHTKSSCTIPSSIEGQTGVVATTNCSVYYQSANVGCGVALNGTSAKTFGTPLNQAGGGIFVMERALGSGGNGVSVWAWNQGDSSIPAALKPGVDSLDSSTFGTPAAHFPVANSACAGDFGAHRLVINIDVGGDLPFGIYSGSSCEAEYGPITSLVGNNGSAFNESYWGIDSIRIFAAGGGDENAANSPIAGTSHTSSAMKLQSSMAFAAVLVATLAYLL